jgi:L-amino acid N-acyltransferase YncA
MQDAAMIAHIHVEAWRSAYHLIIPKTILDSQDVCARQVHWEGVIAQNSLSVYVYVDKENNIIGWAAFGPDRECPDVPDLFELHAIYVAPDKAHKGIGASLLKHGSSELYRLGVRWLSAWVLNDNTNAISFYLKNRFSATPIDSKLIHFEGVDLLEVKILCEL